METQHVSYPADDPQNPVFSRGKGKPESLRDPVEIEPTTCRSRVAFCSGTYKGTVPPGQARDKFCPRWFKIEMQPRYGSTVREENLPSSSRQIIDREDDPFEFTPYTCRNDPVCFGPLESWIKTSLVSCRATRGWPRRERSCAARNMDIRRVSADDYWTLICPFG